MPDARCRNLDARLSVAIDNIVAKSIDIIMRYYTFRVGKRTCFKQKIGNFITTQIHRALQYSFSIREHSFYYGALRQSLIRIHKLS